MDYFFADYNWIEQQVGSHEKALKSLGLTHICYISRGGLFTAHLASQMLGITRLCPLYYDRASRVVLAELPPDLTSASRVLLCEDVAGDGTTLSDCLEFMKSRAASVATLAICHFNGSRLTPDFSFYSGDTICIFPWERHTVNRELRASYKLTHRQDKPDSFYFKYGADLDGVFLPDMPEEGYRNDLAQTLIKRAELLPYSSELHPERDHKGWYIVSGRPEADRQATLAWLAAHGIPCEKLLLRNAREHTIDANDDSHRRAEKAASAKAAHILAEGITHFYESEALQAILIAAKVPMTRVYWWDNHLKIRKRITAGDL